MPQDRLTGRTCNKQTPFKKCQALTGYALWLKDPQHMSSNSLIAIFPNGHSMISVKRATFRQDLCPLSSGVWLYKCMSTSSPSEHFLLKCFTLVCPCMSTLSSYFYQGSGMDKKEFWPSHSIYFSEFSFLLNAEQSLSARGH